MNVTFDEEQQLVRTPQTGAKGLYALVIRWGFAKDEKQANTVLIATVAILALSMIGLWLLGSPSQEKISPKEYADPARVLVQPL